MRKTVVINVVGLSRALIGEHTPFLRSFMERGSMALVKPVFPAVTCTAQSTYLTGTTPQDHGIVGNGWYFKEELEVKFWRQSNRLVQGEKIWDVLSREHEGFTCANLFWWYNMYSTADYSVTPRPNYLADGRKIPDVYSFPPGLRDELQGGLGQFPLFKFWGPATDISSSRWIADAAVKVDEKYDPTLSLVYLPHLDYNLQRHGPDLKKTAKDLQEIDGLLKGLVSYYESREARVLIVSEYGITPVNRPVHLNRMLRKEGLLMVREERGRELLDAGASTAFAVADHQVAHVYVNDKARVKEIAAMIKQAPGVEQVWTGAERETVALDHERAGDIVVAADRDCWFTYYYWLDDKKAPDFARTVDIHRKPGYDPVEMFTDPDKPLVALQILWKLLKKKLGFRVLMDVIPLRPDLVKGSHGRIPEDKDYYPIAISNSQVLKNESIIPPERVFSLIRSLVNKTQTYEKAFS